MPQAPCHPRIRILHLARRFEGFVGAKEAKFGVDIFMLVPRLTVWRDHNSSYTPAAPIPHLLPRKHIRRCVDIVAARLHTPQSLSAACPGRRLAVHQSWQELRLLQTLVPCQQQPPMEGSRETPFALIFPLYRTQAILFSNLR